MNKARPRRLNYEPAGVDVGRLIMIRFEDSHELSRLPAPLLTAYLNIGRDLGVKRSPVPAYITWLKKEAISVFANVNANERALFKEQLRRIEELLSKLTALDKSVVIFAGPKVWEVVPLHVEIENELHWGKPALTQLLWLLAEYRRYGIAVVNRGGVRYFSYRLGEISKLNEIKFEVDTSQWKYEDMGHVARPGIMETYGTQRDVFEHRVDAHYRRLLRATAEELIRLDEKERFNAIFLVGPQRMIEPIAADVPSSLQSSVITIPKDLGKLAQRRLLEHVQPAIEAWERERESRLVNGVLTTDRGTVTGIDETLALLQKRRIRELVLSRDLDARLHRCRNCGTVDASADPVCSVCGGDRYSVRLREALPELIAASEAELNIVSGEAASKLLKQAGGIGAWLAQPKAQVISWPANAR